METGNNGNGMRVCGIIAEYDPFHNGHAWQISRVKQTLRADYIVCVISCGFSQRGSAAFFSTHTRARMALSAGADLVLGMPYAFGTAQANRFAMGGVGILHQLQVITHLCFGVEEQSLPLLSQAADADPLLTGKLKEGKSLARSLGEALSEALPGTSPAVFKAPNFIVGVCYLQALSSLHSAIQPWPVPRQGSYHASGIQPLPSATAVRGALSRGDWAGVEASVPATTLAIIREAAMKGLLHKEDALDSLLLGQLMTISPGQMRDTPEISEGLENRILACSRSVSSRRELIECIKTKRYPYTRISRALTNLMVGIRQDDIPPVPPYARLLGFRRDAAPLLKAIGQSGLPLISRPAKHNGTMLASDMLSEQLWAIGAGLSPDTAYREQVIIQ